MTEAHFYFIAGVLYKAEAPLYLMEAFADALSATNPKFDKTLFLKECNWSKPKDVNQ
jgi:hypothetical protein